LFTIGYEGRALDELLAMLAAQRIDLVIDVRGLPLSRRRGFSKTPLSEALRAEGIDYVHMRAAGNPYRREKATLSTSQLLAKYRAHLNNARDVVQEVATCARDRRTALLCYERDPAHCHRTVLARPVARVLACAVQPL
jgi:uncharacterized protein (DUF488 family)